MKNATFGNLIEIEELSPAQRARIFQLLNAIKIKFTYYKANGRFLLFFGGSNEKIQQTRVLDFLKNNVVIIEYLNTNHNQRRVRSLSGFASLCSNIMIEAEHVEILNSNFERVFWTKLPTILKRNSKDSFNLFVFGTKNPELEKIDFSLLNEANTSDFNSFHTQVQEIHHSVSLIGQKSNENFDLTTLTPSLDRINQSLRDLKETQEIYEKQRKKEVAFIKEKLQSIEQTQEISAQKCEDELTLLRESLQSINDGVQFLSNIKKSEESKEKKNNK